MKHLLLGGVAALALSTAAFAADLPVVPPEEAVAPWTWTGFYIGINGGGAFGEYGDFDFIENGVTLDSFSALEEDGGFFGGQVGYNYQLDSNWVLGVEGDIQKSWIDGDFAGLPADIDAGATGLDDLVGEFDVNWFATLRGRVGYAWDRTLFYATGGVAFADIDQNFDMEFDNGDTASLSNEDDVNVGFTVGAGIEHYFTDHVSLKLEYQFLDFGTVSSTGTSVDGDSVVIERDTSFHTVRAGINYKF